MRFNIRSVGLSPKSERQLKEKNLHWADRVYVMERDQGARISGTYRNLQIPPIEVLHIADEFEYLNSELVEILKNRINASLQLVFGI